MNLIEKIAVEKVETHLSNAMNALHTLRSAMEVSTDEKIKGSHAINCGDVAEQINISVRVLKALKENNN